MTDPKKLFFYLSPLRNALTHHHVKFIADLLQGSRRLLGHAILPSMSDVNDDGQRRDALLLRLLKMPPQSRAETAERARREKATPTRPRRKRDACISVIPDADAALAELKELAGYISDMPELSVEVSRLFDEGTPGFDCEVDWGAAETTRRAVAHYKLPERLRALLVALRAGDRDLDNIKERAGLIRLAD